MGESTSSTDGQGGRERIAQFIIDHEAALRRRIGADILRCLCCMTVRTEGMRSMSTSGDLPYFAAAGLLARKVRSRVEVCDALLRFLLAFPVAPF